MGGWGLGVGWWLGTVVPSIHSIFGGRHGKKNIVSEDNYGASELKGWPMFVSTSKNYTIFASASKSCPRIFFLKASMFHCLIETTSMLFFKIFNNVKDGEIIKMFKNFRIEKEDPRV